MGIFLTKKEKKIIEFTTFFLYFCIVCIFCFGVCPQNFTTSAKFHTWKKKEKREKEK